ncbi:uncharacterized protein BX663DRAFT_438510 [Cokeromyces recurvatus]|uniref:uncharacterized protein n=1 Tax=Cokeromyces recurvatus TaxID=90255 RepID=UPI002221275B|nr:uncharacterized protein BX663DRAFT_438510 [Cokeromyces recurvatus]KAI7901060.1 hypothetical protein BX663DRAFT_438510 [Cokeromyces recurvatus]
MPLNPIPTLTEQLFLTEEEVFTIVRSYLPDGDLISSHLCEWMAKDGAWEFRDFTWKHIINMQQFRSNVKSTMSSICTIGYARKSNTKDSKAAKINSVNLQIYKLKKEASL